MKKANPPQGLFDLLIFVGRFQPFHRGHETVIAQARKRAKHVLVLVGSSNAARSPRNPFAYPERRAMIEETTNDPRVVVRAVPDHLYNDAAWIADVQHEVDSVLAGEPAQRAGQRVGIIGHSKDNSSYYLRIFPGYEPLDVPAARDANGELINATAIRERFLSEDTPGAAAQAVEDEPNLSQATKAIIKPLLHSAPLRAVVAEHAFARTYQAKWAAAPFPPTFMTVDSVVAQSGHVLMVVRNEQPGRGMLALPGGFLKQDETLLDGALRELNEETQIDVPRRVLLGAVKGERTFDDPHRSIRGRTITHTFRFDLNERQLPKVKGSDDASEARWVPLAHITPAQCFEDHAHIIYRMLGVS